jgi:hypothetical protein
MFLKGLNDEIQIQFLNTDYPDFQHLVDKAIIIQNKLKEMEKDGKRKMVFWASILEVALGPAFHSLVSLSEPRSMSEVSESAFLVIDAASQLSNTMS